MLGVRVVGLVDSIGGVRQAGWPRQPPFVLCVQFFVCGRPIYILKSHKLR